MRITLDHVVLPAYDPDESARRFAQIMGVTYAGPDCHFAPVPINDACTITFVRSDPVIGVHVAFHLTKATFDTVLANLRAADVPYGNDPRDPTNRHTYHPYGGRGVYFADANGHFFEVMTKRLEA